jgi:CheY-like chemotaxis protein
MSKLILVVENDEAVRQLLIEALTTEGYQPTEAPNGNRALELLKTVMFDLITLDLEMPDMDGNQFLAELAKVAPAISVLVISANPTKLKPHPQVKAVIAKPFNIEQIFVMLEKYA